MYKVSLIVPCYLRPQRTLRALNAVLEQDMTGWEAYFAGDKCPEIQKLIDSGEAKKIIEQQEHRGNRLAIFNLPIHYGSWGYQARNTCIKLCTGKYTMFMDNDDIIKTNHLSNYYNQISATDNDFMYFNTWLQPIENANGVQGRLRDTQLEHGMIGHQEIIVKSSFLKKMPPEKPYYGHDWELIDNMIQYGAKYEKGIGEPTYLIMGVGELRETEID